MFKLRYSIFHQTKEKNSLIVIKNLIIRDKVFSISTFQVDNVDYLLAKKMYNQKAVEKMISPFFYSLTVLINSKLSAPLHPLRILKLYVDLFMHQRLRNKIRFFHFDYEFQFFMCCPVFPKIDEHVQIDNIFFHSRLLAHRVFYFM